MINISAPEQPKQPNPDFDEPIFEGGKWKVREQLKPDNRGYLWHRFDSSAEAFAFYESK
jgi:glycosidase